MLFIIKEMNQFKKIITKLATWQKLQNHKQLLILTNLKNQLLNVKLILSLIALLLFVFNYEICDLFYYNDINKWWDLKLNIYAVILAISAFIAQYDCKNDLARFILLVFSGLCISDVIDRVFFDITTRQLNDIFSIIIVLITSFYKVYVRQRR